MKKAGPRGPAFSWREPKAQLRSAREARELLVDDEVDMSVLLEVEPAVELGDVLLVPEEELGDVLLDDELGDIVLLLVPEVVELGDVLVLELVLGLVLVLELVLGLVLVLELVLGLVLVDPVLVPLVPTPELWPAPVAPVPDVPAAVDELLDLVSELPLVALSLLVPVPVPVADVPVPVLELCAYDAPIRAAIADAIAARVKLFGSLLIRNLL